MLYTTYLLLCLCTGGAGGETTDLCGAAAPLDPGLYGAALHGLWGRLLPGAPPPPLPLLRARLLRALLAQPDRLAALRDAEAGARLQPVLYLLHVSGTGIYLIPSELRS